MRRKVIAVFLSVACGLVLLLTLSQTTQSNTMLANYYIQNAYDQTSALNVVTSIYLYFRYYDTLFETLMLLFSILGIVALSIHEGEDRDE